VSLVPVPAVARAAPSPAVRDALLVALYLAAYVLLDWVSYVNPVTPLGITPWNPPPGLSMFLLLRGGLRFWPALFVAALAAEVLVRGVPGQWPAALASSAVIAGGYAGAAAVLVRGLRLRPELDTARDLGAFLVVTAAAALVVATAFVGVHAVAGTVRLSEFAGTVGRYWVGDLDGIWVLAPALLTHVRAPGAARPRPQASAPERALQAAALVASLWGVVLAASAWGFMFLSLLFLPLTWIAARGGMGGATLALAAIQLGLIAFIQGDVNLGASFIQLQSVMLVMCVTGLVLGAVVTQRLRVEEDLREKQAALAHALRFAAAGETTSALAHELNQPIAALSNYLGACQLLARGPRADPAMLDETLSKALAEARRAGEVVHRIREFFRRGATQPRAASALEVVQGALESVRRRAEQAAIRLELRAEPGLPLIHADPLQVETAVQNVLHNAVDALLEGHAGPRRIEVDLAARRGGVEIRVRDSGPGVDPAMAAHIFEPFQTSRAEGMGLGLSISRTLLAANGGEIRADAPPGGGARFTLFVPGRPAATGAP
jgi:two-component system, LuxR family, sensor kinase FixL